MSDIVERLQASSALPTGLYAESAAEIRRLRAELAEARDKALREAAKVARDCAIYDANNQLLNSDIRATCAQVIRAMIDTPTPLT